MLARILQPGKNLQTPCTGKGAKRQLKIHIDN
jgi:hypothetical protein